MSMALVHACSRIHMASASVIRLLALLVALVRLDSLAALVALVLLVVRAGIFLWVMAGAPQSRGRRAAVGS